MKETFHYLLMANQAIFHKQLLERLKGSGLSLGQPKVLDYLRDHNGANQTEIATGCHIEPGSLTSLLNRMEEKKMIERKMKDGNRRSYFVYITPYGKELQKQVAQAFDQLEEEVFASFSPQERESFMDAMHKIYEALTEKNKRAERNQRQ